MAKVLTQKNIRRNGSLAQGVVSFQVTAGDTLSGADFDFASNDGTGDTLTFTPRLIEKIINTSASAVTVAGQSINPGSWDFTDLGGMPAGGVSIVVGSGHIFIKLRS